MHLDEIESILGLKAIREPECLESIRLVAIL